MKNWYEARTNELRERGNKGFTLMEMLIVIAIIAVLIAIAIPVFSNQLERSREATDLSNIRSAYAEVMVAYVSDAAQDAESEYEMTVQSQQVVDGWQTYEDADTATLEAMGPLEDGKGEMVEIEVPCHTSGDPYTIKCDAEGTVTIE